MSDEKWVVSTELRVTAINREQDISIAANCNQTFVVLSELGLNHFWKINNYNK